MEKHLGLEHAALGPSLALETCQRCQGRLAVERLPVEDRPAEPVLVWRRCGAEYLGPGGFNLVREIEPAYFRSWRDEPGAPRMLVACQAFFGHDYMEYFVGERYLEPESHAEFSRLFAELMARLQAGASKQATQ